MYTGVELVTGKTHMEPQAFGPPKETHSEGEKLAITAFALGSLGAILTLPRSRRTTIAAAIACGAAGVTLLLLKASIENDVVRAGGVLMEVHFTWSYWLSFLLFVLTATGRGYLFRKASSVPPTTTAAID